MKRTLITLIPALLAAVLAPAPPPACAGGLAPENSCYVHETTHKDFQKAVNAAEKVAGMPLEYAGKRTYFNTGYFVARPLHKSKGMPDAYAVTEDFKKVYARYSSGRNVINGSESYEFYEIDPFRATRSELEPAIRKLSWFETGASCDKSIRNDDDMRRSLSETFTEEKTEKLMGRHFFELDAQGRYGPIGGRGTDATLGNVRFDLKGESDGTRTYGVKAEKIDPDAGERVYLVEKTENYEYEQKNVNGRWLFDKIEPYF